MLAHLDDTPADGLHVTQVAQLGLTEPRNQSSLCRLVAQTFQPSIELWQGLDDVHIACVTVRLQSCKTVRDVPPHGIARRETQRTAQRPFGFSVEIGAGDGNRTHPAQDLPGAISTICVEREVCV
jgi:hypothetical protein